MASPRVVLPLTILTSALVLVSSLLGLFTEWPYAAETPAWRLQGRAQDVGNLAAVLVLLAGLAGLARGGTASRALRGRLLWAGALLFLAYAYFISAIGLHFGPLLLVHTAVLGLSVHLVIAGLPWRDGALVAAGPRRVAGVLLAAIAVAFGALWLSSILRALAQGVVPPELAETGLVANPVHLLDLAVVLPGMLLTARAARRGSGPAQLLLGPWLVFSALMAASVALTLALGQAWVPAAVVAMLVAGSVWSGSAVLAATTPPAGELPEPSGPGARLRLPQRTDVVR